MHIALSGARPLQGAVKGLGPVLRVNDPLPTKVGEPIQISSLELQFCCLKGFRTNTCLVAVLR